MSTISEKTIYQTLAEQPGLSLFTSHIDQAGLASILDGPGPFTVFAPIDAAFAPGAENAQLSNSGSPDPERSTTFVGHHMVPGRLTAQDFSTEMHPTAYDGTDVSIEEAGNRVHIGTASIISSDVSCSNGVLHLIDGILTTPVQVPTAGR